MKKQGKSENKKMKAACCKNSAFRRRPAFAEGYGRARQGYGGQFRLPPSPRLRRRLRAGTARLWRTSPPSAFHPGFTLLEIMIATALFSLVAAGTIAVYIMCNKVWHATSLGMQTVQESSLALSRLVYGTGTNSGLRSAGTVILLTTNVYGHPYPFTDTNKYWETGAKPPSASDTAHYTHVGCSYGTDGSWRLIISNVFNGVQCVDYNSKMRNILFCPDTNQTSAARQKRILIGNYVSVAQVTTNMSGTIGIQLTVTKQDGMFRASNTVSTLVKTRN